MPKLTNIRDVERSVAELQRLTIEIDQEKSSIEEAKAEIDRAFGERIAELAADAEAERRMILEYLKAHKEEFDGPPRSVEFASGTIGYRLGQPRLKPLSKWTWEKVERAIVDARAEAYFRVQLQVNREALLADAEALGADGLRDFGLRVAQEDKAFIDVRREPEIVQEVR